MKYTITNNNLSKLATWVIVLSCFSYPITAVMILKLGLPTQLSNLGLKVIYSIFSLILLLSSLRKTNGLIVKLAIPILIFFMIYSVRLIIDVSLRGIEMAGYSNSYIYAYYFGATVLPCLAIISAKPFLNVNHIIRISFIFLIIANISLLYYILGEGTSGLIARLASRSSVVLEQEKGLGTAFINPITIGHYGALLSTLSISLFIVRKIEVPYVRIFRYGLIILGFINILLGASRGPLLYFALLLILIVAYYLKYSKIDFKMKFKLTIVIFLIFLIIIFVLIPFMKDNDIFLFQRLESFIENFGKEKKEARNYSYISSFQDFLQSPIWGKQFVGTYDNFYPHNIILEILMSLGIIGISLFSIIVYKVFRSGIFLWKNKQHNYLFSLFIMGLLNIMLSMTSGSIFTSPQLWLFIILITFIPYLNLSFNLSSVKK